MPAQSIYDLRTFRRAKVLSRMHSQRLPHGVAYLRVLDCISCPAPWDVRLGFLPLFTHVQKDHR